jgi:hypothetical protein
VIGEKRVGWKSSWRILPKFYQNWQKRSQRKFSEEVPYFAVLTKTQRQRQNLTSISKDPHAECCIYVFCEIDRSLSKTGRTFFSGRKEILGHGNTGSQGGVVSKWGVRRTPTALYFYGAS